MSSFKALFAAFDLYPSPKGAATHIYHSAQALFSFFGKGILFSLSNKAYEQHELLDFQGLEVKHITFDTLIENYLERALAFSNALLDCLQAAPNLEIVHFRDIWSGKAIFESGKKLKTVFEVNAFTSIELPYKYDLPQSVLDKLFVLEQMCLEKADIITCPSMVIQKALIKRGIAESKIKVLPNAAQVTDLSTLNHTPFPKKYILYFGALQAWQGVDDLLKAFAYLKDYEDLYLVLCIAGSEKYAKFYQKLAKHLGIEESIIWRFALDKNTLNHYIHHALFTVAPLKDTPRNTIQGCSPLKIFESMAMKTAVLATDLPVVREILTDNETGKLVRPDRPNELARTMRFMLDYPDFSQEIAENAYQLIVEKYNWEKVKADLFNIYEILIPVLV